MTKSNFLLYLIFFVLTSCGGCSTGLYQDILDAEEQLAKQNFKKAVKIYERILQKKPSKQIQIKINFQLGEIYSVYFKNYKKSVAYFKEITKESNQPKSQVESLDRLGKIYFDNLNDYQAAADIYARLKSFYPTLPNNIQYRFRYAQSLLNLRDYKSSIQLFDELIKDSFIGKKDSDYRIQSYYYKGLAYFYIHSWDEALKTWREYLKYESRKDRITKTKFLMANAYESSERLKEAYNIYYSILGEYPSSEVVKSRLNSLYNRRVNRKR